MKRKKEVQERLKNTILSNIGDSVEGSFSHFMKIGNGVYLVLKDVPPIPLNFQLKRIFSRVYKSLKTKDKIKIELARFGKGRFKNPAKIYDVWINGSKIEAFENKPLEDSELKEFFES